MSALNDDILDIIASSWDGRTLGLTCKRLAARLDASAHVIHAYYAMGTPHECSARCDVMGGDLMFTSHDTTSPQHTIISRLPNEMFHGETVVRNHAESETVVYAFGRIVTIVYSNSAIHNPENRTIVDSIFDGVWCRWMSGTTYIRGDPRNDVGQFIAELPSSCDMFEKTARSWLTANKVCGECTVLPLGSSWARHLLPHTICDGI